MRRNVKIALVWVGLVLGIVILSVGLLGDNLWPSSACPSSKPLPPTTCQPFPYQAIVVVGLAVIAASLVAMAYSFLNRTTPSGTTN